MITFRKAKEEDLELIVKIAEETLPNAYTAIVADGQVAYMLDKMYNKGVLLQQLMEGYTYLIGELNNVPAAFAAFSIVNHEAAIYKLHKLYVLPDQHGKGIGKILMNEVVNQVKRADGKILQLSVNRRNKAKDFYEHTGFKIKESVTLDMGNGFFIDAYLMELPLIQGK